MQFNTKIATVLRKAESARAQCAPRCSQTDPGLRTGIFLQKVSTEKFSYSQEIRNRVEFNRFVVRRSSHKIQFSLYLFFNCSGVWTQRSHGERQPSPPGKHALALRVHSSMIPKRGNLTFFVLLTIHHPPPPLSLFTLLSQPVSNGRVSKKQDS